jgi:multidrug efflux pump subunit AcrA (membrane-fusion protein)
MKGKEAARMARQRQIEAQQQAETSADAATVAKAEQAQLRAELEQVQREVVLLREQNGQMLEAAEDGWRLVEVEEDLTDLAIAFDLFVAEINRLMKFYGYKFGPEDYESVRELLGPRLFSVFLSGPTQTRSTRRAVRHTKAGAVRHIMRRDG